jgi:hypothetical protein
MEEKQKKVCVHNEISGDRSLEGQEIMSMEPRAEHNYFCEFFRFLYLPRLFYMTKGRVRIYYLKPNWESAFFSAIARLLKKKFVIEQLPYDLATINNTLNGQVRTKAYIDDLYKIMRRIDSELFSTDSTPFLSLDKKLAGIKKSLQLYIKHQIALDIRQGLLMVEVCDWLSHNPQSQFYGSSITLLSDELNYWTKFVRDLANEKKIQLIRFSKFKKERNKAFGFCLCFFIQPFFSSMHKLFASLAGRRNKIKNNKLPKIGISFYALQKNFSEFLKKRNYYLFWFPQSGIRSDQVVIYAPDERDGYIPGEEVKAIKDIGFSLINSNHSDFLRIILNPVARYTSNLRVLKLLLFYMKEVIRLRFCVRSRPMLEEWKILAVLFSRLHYWEDFFAANSIKINFRYHDHFSARDIAALLAGTVTVSYHYSNHSLSTFDILNHDLCDVFFIWGKEYEKCFCSVHSDIKTLVQTGYIFDYTFLKGEKEAGLLRDNFRQGNIRFLITILDENLEGPLRDGILTLYRNIMEFMKNTPDTGLIIKPKKDKNLEILSVSDKTADVFACLRKENRIKILDSTRYPIEAGKAADLVIGVFVDSTAAMECSFAGVPTIIYECCFGRQPMHPYHRLGENKVLFYDSEVMLDSIKKFKDNPCQPNGFADWSGILKDNDPFRDGQANKRIGLYLKKLLDGFAAGLSKEKAIVQANHMYTAKFGPDKVKDCNEKN